MILYGHGEYLLNMNDRMQQAVEDSAIWFPTNIHDQSERALILWALCICGEAGELANKVKKFARGSLTLGEVLPLAADELVDVLVYCFNMAAALDIDLEHEYDRKRRVNVDRFRKGSE